MTLLGGERIRRNSETCKGARSSRKILKNTAINILICKRNVMRLRKKQQKYFAILKQLNMEVVV
jgi:hypothetical protein